MARTIKPATLKTIDDIDHAAALLKSAAKVLRQAGAEQAARAVRRAIKSTEGASRHAWHRYNRNKEA